MTSKPILYGTLTSPGVNAVIMTLKALNIDYGFQEVKPLKDENLNPEFLRKNPTGTIPVLETEDHQFIGDSHAIVAYLADRYGKDDSLYPKDLYKRAKVHQLQHFSDSVLFTTCVRPAYYPLFYRLSTTVPEEVLKRFDEAFIMLERFLGEPGKWVAGDQLTIADFNCVTSVCGLVYFRPITEESHPALSDWLKRMLEIPYVLEYVTGDKMTSSHRFLEKHVSHL